MKKSQNDIKRHTLCYQLRGKRSKILYTVFTNFDLDGMKDRLRYWQYAGLVNNYGCFETPEERKMLIGFCEDLEKLFEAFYVESKVREKNLKRLKPEIRKVLKKFNRCSVLSKEEALNPQPVLKLFSEKYRRLYVQAELYCMLEAVITNDEDGEREKLSAIPFFQCVNGLINLLYKE